MLSVLLNSVKTKIHKLMNVPSVSVLPIGQPAYLSALHNQHSEKVLDNRSRTFYTDEAIIDGLNSRDLVIIKYLYKRFSREISYLVTTNSGTKMDAEDLFQDALVVLYQKVSTGNLKLTCSFNTYFYAICRHLWLQRLSKRELSCEYKDLAGLDEWQDDNNIEEHLEESEKYKLFQQHFLRLSADDQKVLKLFMSKVALKEIAHIMGYKSVKYAKFRKYICKEKLKNSILKDPHYQVIYQLTA
jgi:RNA polymerase sigma factor (sigma-70 family)